MKWVKNFSILMIVLHALGCGMIVHSMNKDVLSSLSDYQVLGQACDLYGMWDNGIIGVPVCLISMKLSNVV